ncbi:DNA mismatch endonuclease Vsr [Rhizobium leguminosarum]|uniref:very short patch repair endonuclease n=1 Tax=Rhizobium leguminosarum TaxID=384 RepID=UPI0009B73E97|nr:very short patch repair endonuclease [Rhizobium leguminosarum]MBY3031554.1 DNA mismatch endonuclease Vsr [Rhizobium leguminosarum]
MVDRLTSERRSWLMSRVKGKNTSPELKVRRTLHALGFRFRLHRKDLPGNPDIVLPKLMRAVFVHGCFWHRHPGCKKASVPKTRPEFWHQKFANNVERDTRTTVALGAIGWTVVVIWECETKDPDELRRRLVELVGVTKEAAQ